MARRRTASFGWWKFLLGLIVVSLCAGGVAAWVTSYNVKQRRAGEAGLTIPAMGPGNPSGGFTTNAKDLGKLSREDLVSEVSRLNGELAERNRQIDDLKIQLKLMGEGSRTE